MNMKIPHVLILTALLVFATSAYGRLGETRKQIDKRYGQGTRSETQRLEGAETIKYYFGNLEIEVVFHDDKSIWEIFHNPQNRPISTRDIKMLLEANAGGGHTWEYEGMSHGWKRSRSPKYIGYLWQGHEDYFCIEDVKAVGAIQNRNASETGGF